MVDVTIDGQMTAASFDPSTTSGIIGTTTNDDAAAGSVGQTVSASVTVGSAIALTTLTITDLASISLTAGDWIVSGAMGCNPDGTTNLVYFTGWSSDVSATLPEEQFTARFSNPSSGIVYAGFGLQSITIPTRRYALSVTTTIYLSIVSSFTISTNEGFGFIQARRIR